MSRRSPCKSMVTGLALLLVSTAVDADRAMNRFLLEAMSELPPPVSGLAPERASWLSASELRYDVNDNGDYSLALRYSPGDADRGDEEFRIQQLLLARESSLVRREQGRDLLQRYQQLLEMISLQASLDGLRAELNLDGARVEHQRAQVNSESFRVADLQKAELAQARTRQQIELTRLKLQTLLTIFAGSSGSRLNVDDWDDQLVEWDAIMGELDLVRQPDLQLAAEQSLDGIDRRLAREKLKIERDDRARWFEFLEVKFRELDSGDQETSFGLSIPLGSRPLGMVQGSLALNRADYEFRTNLQRRQSKLESLQRELQWSYQQVLSLQKHRQALQQQMLKLQGVNQPELLFALKSDLLQVEAQLRQFRIRGVETFLALLQENDRLSLTPLRNWMLQTRPLL